MANSHYHAIHVPNVISCDRGWPGWHRRSGPKADRLAVLETLRIYLTVTDDRAQSAIQDSFHPTAHLMSVSGKGALRALTQDFWWERISQIPENTPARKAGF